MKVSLLDRMVYRGSGLVGQSDSDGVTLTLYPNFYSLVNRRWKNSSSGYRQCRDRSLVAIESLSTKHIFHTPYTKTPICWCWEYLNVILRIVFPAVEIVTENVTDFDRILPWYYRQWIMKQGHGQYQRDLSNDRWSLLSRHFARREWVFHRFLPRYTLEISSWLILYELYIWIKRTFYNV